MYSFRMVNNSAFNVAFIISLVWHLVCMSAVNIVVLPGKFKARKLTSVSFLGPILETTALNIILADKPVAIAVSYRTDLKYRRGFGKDGKNDVSDPVKRYIRNNTEDNMRKMLSVPFQENKDVPDIIIAGIKRQNGRRFDSSDISGSAARRTLFFKPVQPKLPDSIPASAPFKLELKFSVLPQGEVGRVIPVVSSGNPEVDLLGIRYLKSWKFFPLVGGSDEEQWSRITFIFGGEDKMP